MELLYRDGNSALSVTIWEGKTRRFHPSDGAGSGKSPFIVKGKGRIGTQGEKHCINAVTGPAGWNNRAQGSTALCRATCRPHLLSLFIPSPKL
jgi:hypothetical protein